MLGYITWDVSPYLIGGTPDAAINVRWYSLMFAIGFIVGYNMVARMFKHEGAPEKWLGTLLLWLVGGTMVGARLGHVFFYEWDHYSAHPMEIFKIWEGGLASHGGAIGVIIAVCLFSYFSTKRSPLWTLDRIAAPVALVSCLIRVGNLFNSEIFGPPTDLPWGFKFVNNYTWNRWFFDKPCHPTQIYEALCYLALFGLLFWLYWKKNAQARQGLLVGIFLIGTFLSRFLIEFVKNVQVSDEVGMSLNYGQMLSIPFIIAGIALVIYALYRPKETIEFPNCYAEELNKKSRK